MTADADYVLTQQPGAVIVATGGECSKESTSGFLPRAIPGWKRDFVFTPERVLEDGVRLSACRRP